ncbi:MAG: hypothetical protein DMF58_17335 [Acidobacteria bacterium]|nr:MAG: hypothetical protein DMF58_17335 [Acidobacteriota bacterium]
MESDKVVCEACRRPSPLRRCLTCGYVGCCESYGAHDTEHAHASGHMATMKNVAAVCRLRMT